MHVLPDSVCVPNALNMQYGIVDSKVMCVMIQMIPLYMASFCILFMSPSEQECFLFIYYLAYVVSFSIGFFSNSVEFKEPHLPNAELYDVLIQAMLTN